MRVFSRRKGRHHRHGSLTGWAALSSLRPAASVVVGRRRTPLALLPVDADLIPFADYRHPYQESR